MNTSVLLRPVRAAFRALLWVANSAKATVLSFLGLIVASAVLYSLLEKRDVGDSIWWAVVTASTVGYGDTYPTTAGGRILAGTLISAMVLLVIPLILLIRPNRGSTDESIAHAAMD